MKTAIRWTAIFLLPLLFLAFAAPLIGPAHAAAVIAWQHPAASITMLGVGMLFPMGQPADLATLEKLRTAPAGGYETYEDVLYDEQTYAAAGVAQIVFFGNAQSDRTLSNLTQPGQLPAPHYFRVQRIFISPQTEPSISAAQDTAGRLRDWDRILNTGRATLTFSNSASNRTRGPWPCRAIGQLGGTRGVIVPGVAAAAPVFPIQHVQNDGGSGFPFDIVLKWGETFTFTMNLAAAQAISANLNIQLALYGWRYAKAS
jgi:hypothetical protein